MAHENSEVIAFALDDSTGSLVDFSGNVNSITWDGGQDLLEDTGMGDSRRTVIQGLANASNIQVNGMHDSTTRAMVAPVVDGTSVTKTVELQLASGDVWTGEVWPEQVTGVGANVGEINTWSINLRAQNGLSSTSVFSA